MGDDDAQWARTDEGLKRMVDRVGARPRDVLFETTTRDEVPWRSALADAWPRSRRVDKHPIVWLDYESSSGKKRSLVVTLMRFWAKADPCKSIIQFMRRWHVIEQSWGTDLPFSDKWERLDQQVRGCDDKKWAVLAVWPRGTDAEGICIVDQSWFVADPSYTRRREERL